MDRRATLCPDSLLPRAPSIFPGQRSLTALMIVAHLKIDAEHNWSVTRAPRICPPPLWIARIPMLGIDRCANWSSLKCHLVNQKTKVFYGTKQQAIPGRRRHPPGFHQEGNDCR